MRKKMKKILFSVLFPVYYKWQCRRPIKKGNVLFIELRHVIMPNDFQYLYKELEQQDMSCSLYCMGNHHITGFAYFKRCLEMLKKLAVSEYAFINDVNNVIGSIKLRKGTMLIQTWHGCGAFKKFGFTLNEKLESNYYPKCDIVTVSSPAVVDIYAKAMGQSVDNIYPVGVSRTDLFFLKERCNKIREHCLKKIDRGWHKKYILYAPTFRGNAHNPENPKLLQPEELYDALSDEYRILYKGHPTMNGMVVVSERYEDFFLDVSNEYTIEELMILSDVCITDYSSLIFEYALLDKPMVFYAYDRNEYEQERGLNFPYKEFIPGPCCETAEQVIEAIKMPKDEYKEKREEFKRKYMDACDGQSTKRIINLMKKKREQMERAELR